MSEQPESMVAAEKTDSQRAAWRALPGRLFALLLSFDAFFVAVFLALVVLNLRRTVLFTAFDLDLEANAPSGYSAFQLFLVAIGFLVLGSRLIPERRRAAILRPLWRVLGVGFALIALDEVGKIHERMPIWRLRVFNIGRIDPWMTMYSVIAVVLAVLLFKQVMLAWREWRGEMMLFLLGIGVLGTGALVLEGVQIVMRWQGPARYFEVAAEEGLEMLGASILALAAYRILSAVMSSDPDATETG